MLTPENPEIKSVDLLMFCVGNIRCAVPVTDIDNVIRMVEITPEGDVSDLNKGIAGSLIYHGEVAPVYSLDVFFGGRMPEPALTDNLVLISPGGRNSALWINRIDKVCGSENIVNIREYEPEDKGNNEDFQPEIPGVKIYRHISGINKEPLPSQNPDSERVADYAGKSVCSTEEIILMISDLNIFIDQGLKGRLSQLSGYIRKRSESEIPRDERKFSESEIAVAESKGVIMTDVDTTLNISLYPDSLSLGPENVKKILRDRRAQIEKPEEKEEESEKIEILRFRLMYAEYAVEMKYIREVLINERITPIPGVPDFIMGIFALRGEIISLVNLRVLFSLPKAGITDLNRVIILSNGDITFGILADYITDIGTIPVNQIKIPDEKTQPIDINYIKGIADGSLIVLDAKSLLSNPRMVINEK